MDDIQAMKDEYRMRNCLPPDAPVIVMLGDDPKTAYVHQQDSWVFMDGGTLDLGCFREDVRGRLAYRLRRVARLPRCARSWLRYGGWRW